MAMISWSKKWAILLLVLLVLASSVALYKFDISKDSNSTSGVPDTTKINTNDSTIISNYNIDSADEITKDYTNPNEAVIVLLASGHRKLSVQKYDEAYDYFEKASKLDGITDDYKNSAIFGMYSVAEATQDSSKMDSTRRDLGEETFAIYTTLNKEEERE
ncbi:MAG: hypothetical protein Q7T41_01010 [Candidatus Saccharibacteria bacterium]|nr:hypothetical protein [Candidatus Saccharibacteria bacterium]